LGRRAGQGNATTCKFGGSLRAFAMRILEFDVNVRDVGYIFAKKIALVIKSFNVART